MGTLLFVGAPQGGGPLHEAGQGAGGGGAGPAGHAETDVVQGDGAVQPGGQYLADQVGHLAAWPLALQPPRHGGVFIAEREAPTAPRLVHMGGETGVRDPRLVQDGVKERVGLHGMTPECLMPSA